MRRETTTLPRIHLSPPEVGVVERQMLLDALDSNWVAPVGPHVDAFEREVAAASGRQHGVALSSGTAAIHLSLQLLGVGPGDVVIAPTLTFIGSVASVNHLGATPVFLDAEAGSWNLDPDLLETELTDRAKQGTLPKAVITVDLYGQCADYDRIVPMCEQYGVPIVEDAAEALGATWRGSAAGSFGAFGALSFNGNKIVTTSGGGMLVTDDEQSATRAAYLASQARMPEAHYEHSELGYNYRLSNLLAALGRGQLASLPRRLAAKREIRDRYVAALGGLPGFTFPTEDARGRSNHWLSTCVVDPATAGVSRDELRAALAEHEIEARAVWKPMHLQPVYADAPVRLNGVSDAVFRDGICLPSGVGLTHDDQQRVIDAVLATVHQRAPLGALHR